MTQTHSTTALDIFKYNQQDLRVMLIDGEPWWVASDVCKILELGNVSMAVNGNKKTNNEGLDEDEKGIMFIDTSGGKQKMLCINEPGLYKLIFKSRKPEAKTFKRWVTHEVLPAIRKTGSYHVVEQPAQAKPLQGEEVYLLVLFYNTLPLRVSLAGDTPWFVVNDVCTALHLTRAVARGVEPTEKQWYPVDTPGGKQSMLHLTEAGVITLMLSAEKVFARAFNRWFLYDALPVVREKCTTHLLLPAPDQKKPLRVEEMDWRILHAIIQSERRMRAPSLTDLYQRLYRSVSREELKNRLSVLALRGDIQATRSPKTTRYSVV